MRRFDLHQETAEKKSAKLYLQMAIVQVATVTITALVMGAVIAFVIGVHTALDNRTEVATEGFLWIVFAVATCASLIVVSAIIAVGSSWKFRELKEGGKKVAELLHAAQIAEETEHRHERQLLNIVQELAVSASIPAPAVYVMRRELGINALAAGHTPADAVIIITEGALKRLSRDQMQGIIAHEFAHIISGDIANNMWLMAVTHGNYCICVAAEDLIFSVDSPQHGAETIGAIILGYVLYPLGLLNAMLALAFTARIKREGEYLADATAVELARYPRGLAEALMMIGGNQTQGQVRRSSAMAANHLFLVNGFKVQNSIFDAHPPLDERIIRLQEDWDGYYLFESEDDLEVYGEAYDEVVELSGFKKRMDKSTKRTTFTRQVESVLPSVAAGAAIVSASATPSVAQNVPEELFAEDETAPAWMADEESRDVEIDQNYRDLAAHSEAAGLVLAALRLNQFDESRADQLLGQLNPAIATSIKKMRPALAQLDQGQTMWMFDNTLQTMTKAPAIVRSLFNDFLKKTSIAAEEETDLSRWAWQRIVHAQVDNQEPPKARHGDVEDLLAEALILLSMFVHTDADSEMTGQYNFMRAVSHVGLSQSVLVPADQLEIAEVDDALNRLAFLSARERRKIVVACMSSATANRDINLEEAWLMRVICSSMNFPLPKIFPGQVLAPGI